MSGNQFVQGILNELVAKLYDVPLMGNVNRSDYVEHMVIHGLGKGFRLVSGDWAGWDIEHESGARIEVKQSAACQPWTKPTSKPASGSFDIAPRTGNWVGGSEWVEKVGRQAHLYIFAWHPVTLADQPDHRDPDQWEFFVVKADDLPPNQKSISANVVRTRWSCVRFKDLRQITMARVRELNVDADLSSNNA